MDIVRTLEAPGPAERLFSFVDDLEAYRRWMPLVHSVTALDADGGVAAWEIELRATVGLLARSKRLRMVRSERVEPEHVVFERAEVDGRAHAPWILRAAIAPIPTSDAMTGDGASAEDADDAAGDRTDHPVDNVILTMSLHYGGSLWTGAALQRVLDHGVDRASRNLVDLLSCEPTR